MKQVNFSHSGGFPLEQETLERLQTAYRSELYEAIKAHFSIELDKNYIITHATTGTKGWVIINRDQNNLQLPGILYPIAEGSNTGYLKTTRIGTNLVYGTGVSQTAYFDYEAKYISSSDYSNRPTNSQNNDALTVNYYNLQSFKTIKDIKSIEANIDLINQSYLPLNGSKAMQGDLDLGTYQLSKLDTKENSIANVRSAELKLGSVNKRGLRHSGDYLGRALVDNSTSSETNLSLNYNTDWDNTYIGGKVYLNNLNTTTSNGTLLVLDNQNQVNKNNTLIDSLINRITDLENRPASTVPIGMIALWGKSAPFPEGWEEYVPLRGRMPIGLDTSDSSFNTLLDYGGNKNKTLSITELPPHDHEIGYNGNNAHGSGSEKTIDTEGTSANKQKTSQTGGGQAFSLMNPYRVVHFIVYTGNPTDTTPPTSPNNLTVTNIGTTSLTLNWTAATDNVAVANYLVYRNGILTATLNNILTYNASGLSAGTSYNFYIVAKDAAGNVSNSSNIINVTTTAEDTIPPTTPTFLNYSVEGNYITLSWYPSTDNVGVVRYEVYRRTSNGDVSQSYLGTPDNFCTVYGSSNTTYYYKVRAKDAAGNLSGFTSEVAVSIGSENGGSCFDIDSTVTMASGQSKKLKNIVVGDKLQGLAFPNEVDESDGDYMLWNGLLSEASKAEVVVVAKHTSTQPNYFEITTVDNTTFKVTGEHPLLITEDDENVKWLQVKNILENMSLIDKTGKTKAIKTIVFKEETLEVASLDVETVDNYVISGIVAHNKQIEQQPEN